jgi:monofunctional biosynthetic peptidoglycan transglycosylase
MACVMTDIAPEILEPSGIPSSEQKEQSSPRRRILRVALVALAAFFFAPYLLTLLYVFIDPPFSALMLRQALTGGPVTYEWRDLDQISPNLIAQVIAAEDGRFCTHHGVDWAALDKVADAVVDGKPKGGGSTITMQTAKNLFLWSRPAILRKPFEIPLAAFMDLALGKSRVIEIYLNIVEWGPGVYGAEAAAQHHFGKSAADLTPQEAAQLAAALPNPKRRNAGNPGPRTMAFANRLRMKALRERGDSVCVLDADSERGDDASE